jgi:hypothetical protein
MPLILNSLALPEKIFVREDDLKAVEEDGWGVTPQVCVCARARDTGAVLLTALLRSGMDADVAHTHT